MQDSANIPKSGITEEDPWCYKGSGTPLCSVTWHEERAWHSRWNYLVSAETVEQVL